MNLPRLTQSLEKLTQRQLLLLAVAVSCLIALFLYFYLSGLEKSKPAAVSKVSNAVVAAVDIPERTVIQPQMLKAVQMPDELLPPGAVAEMQIAVGKTTKTKIFQGDPLTAKKWFADVRQESFTGSIPADKRALSVPVSDITGISGFARPGDYVDVMMISDKVHKNAISGNMIMQNILLLGLNKTGYTGEEQKESKKETMATATLAVAPEEAIRLAAAQMQGMLYLALRPFNPQSTVITATEFMAPLPEKEQAAAAVPVNANQPAAIRPEAQAPLRSKPWNSISVIRGTSANMVEVKE